jgi:ssDNA-binding Zn-finger/Zn-ribbon topoisomerase 1
MADKTIICKDCNNEFVFTEGEQEFYKEKGFENEPQRCPDCRKARKMSRRNSGGGFNSIGRSIGRNYGGKW